MPAKKSMENSRKKILFKLEKDEDDYPPVDFESLWAIEKGKNKYEIDNIPFFAQGISLRDLISTTSKDGELFFKEIKKQGGHSTLRISFDDDSQKDIVKSEILKMKCHYEGSHLSSLYAIDIPPDVNYRAVTDFLEKKLRAGVLEYETACEQHG